MAVVNERIVARPHFLDDFHAQHRGHVMLDTDQPAAGAQSTRQGCHDPLRLEFERGARPIRLRGDDQIIVGERAAGLGNDRIEQEAVILAIDDHHHRHARTPDCRCARSPRPSISWRQERLEIDDLLFEAVRGIAGERQLVTPSDPSGV